MKKSTCLLSLIVPAVLCVPLAAGDENNLSGGAFVTHYESAIVYTSSVPAGGWCAQYTPHAISDPAQEVIRVDGPGDYVWWVLAAFDEPKTWCGTEFGFGTYTETVWGFNEIEPCFPDQGLEIPTEDWPGPNQGTALVTTTVSWQGNWIPVYKFSGYAYAVSYGTTVMPISFDPGSANRICGFSSCTNPPQDFEVPENHGEDIRRGGMGVNMDGIRARPNVDPQRVCCVSTTCFIRTELDCADLGGEWFSALTVCEPNPCIPSACCVGEVCVVTTVDDCSMMGGTWQSGISTCDPNPCIPSACCHGPVAEYCTLATLRECQLMSGFWHPEFDTCTPTPCMERACCFEEGLCIAYSEVECLAAGGIWMSTYESCTPNPCPRVCCIQGACQLMSQQNCMTAGGEWFPAWESCSPNPCPQIYTVAPDGSGDFPTIQIALDAVSPGDIIELTDGVFEGAGNRDLDFLGKAVTVRSQSGNPATCIIDCGGTAAQPHRGFDFHSGEGVASILDGVTIRGGLVPSGPQGSRGAGIRCVQASPTILSCVITANAADEGCAIYCDTAAPTIGHCTLAGNAPAGSNGSALALAGSSAPLLENTLIAFNDGCTAVDCGAAGAPLLSCCDIFGNPGGDWTGAIAPQLGVNGNLSADPLLCDLAAGDAHLSCDSPCLEDTECGPIGALPEGCQLYGITSIRDVPHDQGRAVRIRWHRACTDLASGDPPITLYSLWRRIDEGDRPSAHPGAAEETSGRDYPPGEWEYVTGVPACGEATYATICATVCDSTLSSGMCWSAFFIRAHTAVPSVYFDTSPDSGYSLDNLAPAPPENLSLPVPSLLTWNASSAADFDYFTVYGSRSEQFDPTAVRLGRTSGTTFVLPQPPYPCYHVTATDFSGNESGASTLCDYSGTPNPEAIPSRFALGPVQPNPLRTGTRIQLDVPRASEVSLRVYDAAGRLVATLVEGPLAPGRHQVEWTRVGGSASPVPAGIYFLQMRSGRFTERKAVVVLE